MTPPPPRAPRGPAGGRRTLRALAAGAVATALTGLSLYGGPLSAGAAAAGAAPRATTTRAGTTSAGTASAVAPATFRSATATSADPVTVTLAGVSPTIARPGNPVVLSGTLRNTGTTAIATATVRARLSTTGLQTRAGVQSWAAGDSPQATGPVVASEDLAEPLPAGGTASFRLTIPADAVRNGEGFAALPLAVDADTGGTVLGQARTFLPWYYKKEFVAPLALTTVVPLTLDADPNLFTAPGAERNKAWSAAIGPDSRLQSVLTGTADAPVTWAIDPAVLGPAADASAAPGNSPTGTAGGRAPTPTATPTPRGGGRTPPGRGRRTGPDLGPGLPAGRRLGRARPVGAALRRPGHRHGPERPDRRRTAGPAADAGHEAAPVGAHRHRLAGRQPVAGAAGAGPAPVVPGADRRRRVHLRPDPRPGLHR